MTGSRLVAFIYFWDRSQSDNGRVCLRLGEDAAIVCPPSHAVFDLSSVDVSGLITSDYQIAFLDEFRVMAAYCSGTSELSVFDTLVPQDYPGNSRWFRLPQKYHRQGSVSKALPLLWRSTATDILWCSNVSSGLRFN